MKKAHSQRTAENKARRIERMKKLSLRWPEHVSENCRKSRAKRRRAQDYRDAVKSGVKFIDSPSGLGERQFGNRAKGHHLHQREHGLATALTTKEFQKMDERRKMIEGGKVTLTDTK